jgi:hypothetical protein
MTNRKRIDEAAGLISLTRFVGSAIAIAIGAAWFIERTANVSILPV